MHNPPTPRLRRDKRVMRSQAPPASINREQARTPNQSHTERMRYVLSEHA